MLAWHVSEHRRGFQPDCQLRVQELVKLTVGAARIPTRRHQHVAAPLSLLPDRGVEIVHRRTVDDARVQAHKLQHLTSAHPEIIAPLEVQVQVVAPKHEGRLAHAVGQHVDLVLLGVVQLRRLALAGRAARLAWLVNMTLIGVHGRRDGGHGIRQVPLDVDLHPNHVL